MRAPVQVVTLWAWGFYVGLGIDSKVLPAFVRATGQAATTRNWSTVLKLQSLAGAGGDPA